MKKSPVGPPTITITFEEPTNPRFEFTNWRPGISLGQVEHSTLLLLREAQRAQATLINNLRQQDALPPKTTMSDIGEVAEG